MVVRASFGIRWETGVQLGEQDTAVLEQGTAIVRAFEDRPVTKGASG